MKINKETLEDIDYIISHFVENNNSETISFAALAFCLQVLLDAKKELEEKLK